MTHRPDRTLDVRALARVEGEGAMHVRVRDGTVEDVRLEIYEPPRFFEAFLRGRRHTEPPDITARICGICPVAYQMSACRGHRGRLRRDRRPGRSPTCAGCSTAASGSRATPCTSTCCTRRTSSATPSALDLAQDRRDLVERGLALKKAGNEIIELLGGRAIHPVNVRVGGFYRAPTPRRPGAAGANRCGVALDQALDTVEWVAGFDFPDFHHDHEMLALVDARPVRHRVAARRHHRRADVPGAARSRTT